MMTVTVTVPWIYTYTVGYDIIVLPRYSIQAPIFPSMPSDHKNAATGRRET
jgi:hypothetical protein